MLIIDKLTQRTRVITHRAIDVDAALEREPDPMRRIPVGIKPRRSKHGGRVSGLNECDRIFAADARNGLIDDDIREELSSNPENELIERIDEEREADVEALIEDGAPVERVLSHLESIHSPL